MAHSTAQAGANPVQDAIRQSGTAKDYPSADRLVVFDSTVVDMQESGLSFFDKHTVYKALTQKGANAMSVLIYDYDPLTAYVDIRLVVVHRQSGQTDTLPIKLYDYAAPARAIYWGARQKMIEVGRLWPGDALEVRSQKKGFTYALLTDANDTDEQYIPPMRGHFYDIVAFWAGIPVKVKYYELRVPKTKKVQYEVYNGELNATKDEINGKYRFAFSATNIKPFEQEANMVALADVGTKLVLSTAADWQSKSRWFYNVNEEYGSFVATSEVQAKVNELLIGAANELDSVARLTHWVADNMRYSGISIGKGEGYTLHNAKMNFTDRCGVCKDKASLLVSMLRAAGFEAYPAMTMAGERIDNIPADQFNHSVAAVRLKADQQLHLLDPTWVPFVRELWSSAEQQQQYLIGTKDGLGLMETPISPAENHYIKISGLSEVSDNGTLKGEFVITAEGQSDAAFRGIFTRQYKAQWRQAIENELLKVSPLFNIDSLNFGNPWDYSSAIKIFVKYTIPNYAIVTPEEIIFTPILATQIFERQNPHLSIDTKPEERKYPFKDRCSRLVEIDEVIKLPAFTAAVSVPTAETVEGSGASFEGKYEIEGSKLKFNQRATYKKRVYQPIDWDSFRKTVLAQKEFANKKVILKRQ